MNSSNSMPLVIAAGVASVLTLVAWAAFSVARAGATGALARNGTIGVRLPALMQSDTAWQSGHAAAEKVYIWVAIVTSLLAMWSIIAAGDISWYVIAVSSATICVASGVAIGAILAMRAARR